MRIFAKLIIAIFIFYFSLVALLFIFQRNLIFPSPRYTETPQIAGLKNFAEEKLALKNGTNIYAWYADTNKNHKTIIYFSGNAERLDHSANFLESLSAAGFNVFAVQYSGYGKSGGRASEQSLYDDGRAAINYLTTKTPETSIIVLGRSIGTGVAAQMASEYNLGGIILWSPYTSIEDLAGNIYWYFPIKQLHLVRDKLDTLSKIKQITEPLLIIHGRKDGLIPLAYAQKLFDAANEPKKIIIYPEADHVNFDNAMVIQEIKLFLGNKNEYPAIHNR